MTSNSKRMASNWDPRLAAAEFLHFGLKQASSCVFGAMLLAVLLATRETSTVAGVSRQDFLFLFALALQAMLLILRMEHWQEVKVTILFHLLATFMECFKTSPGIASWSYARQDALFQIYQVPLFAGFLYSAVGSYIARAWRIFEFRFTGFPPASRTLPVALAAYLNFFTHHFVPDLRWLLIGLSLVIFWKCRVHYQIRTRYRSMPLLPGLFAVTFFIWLAENIGTYAKAWAYPNQAHGWEMVGLGKLTSWFLLMLLSFVLVSLIQERKPPRSRL